MWIVQNTPSAVRVYFVLYFIMFLPSIKKTAQHDAILNAFSITFVHWYVQYKVVALLDCITHPLYVLRTENKSLDCNVTKLCMCIVPTVPQ